MGSVKGFLRSLDISVQDEPDDRAVEVYADSLKQALEMASEELGVSVSMLDYDILEKGSDGFFGIGRQPYHIIIRPVPQAEPDMDFQALTRRFTPEAENFDIPENFDEDSTFKIRVTKTGIWFTAYPPKGKGLPLDGATVRNQLASMRIEKYNKINLDKAVKKMTGKPVRIGDWVADPELDGTMSVRISDNSMKAFVTFTAPRYSGCHLEYTEVIEELKLNGVVFGFREGEIDDYLNRMEYGKPLLAAEGQFPVPGKDAYIDYRVSVDKSGVRFEEDENGKVDFKNLELLENVTAGQLLAVKVPAEEGIEGHTVTGKVLEVKEPKDTEINHGKGTILSEDGTELTAEINGQVVFKRGVISVEPVYMVNGDVGLQTGNIVFLGAVVVTGSVQDNFSVKASGNIEVRGTVQKASLEADGDVIVHQGITGRDGARIESLGGSVFAKFIQNAYISASNDVIVPEGIMHSDVDAGNRVISSGRRAKIVGGTIRAENEVNSRFIGGEGAARTDIMVGVAPRLLQRIADLKKQKEETDSEIERLSMDIKTLQSQQGSGRFTDEKQQMLDDYTDRVEKLQETKTEVDSELEERNEYLSQLEPKGKVCIEKTLYPGVDLFFAGADEPFRVQDEYHYITFGLDNGLIMPLREYEAPVATEGDSRIRTVLTRKRRHRGA